MFKDRQEAGERLANELLEYKGKKNTLVLGIPRGGVIVAHEAAKILGLPLDVIVIKKIGYPGNEELALGAAGLNTSYLNKDLVNTVSPEYIKEQVKIKQAEVSKRYKLFRGKKRMYTVKGKTVIIIDDGIATGATIKMAVELVRKGKPKKVVIAAPVAPPDTVKELEGIADKVVCLETPSFFMAIGQFYNNFEQVENNEVKALLKKSR